MRRSISSERAVRALGLDYGEKRIGVAVSDLTGTLASPLETLVRRRGKRAPFGPLCEIATRASARQLVVGLPLEGDGSENDWCDEVRSFGAKFSDRAGIPVCFVDERHTSIEAEERIRSSGLPRSKREEKDRIDAAAAAIILQSWLDGAPEL